MGYCPGRRRRGGRRRREGRTRHWLRGTWQHPRYSAEPRLGVGAVVFVFSEGGSVRLPCFPAEHVVVLLSPPPQAAQQLQHAHLPLPSLQTKFLGAWDSQKSYTTIIVWNRTLSVKILNGPGGGLLLQHRHTEPSLWKTEVDGPPAPRNLWTTCQKASCHCGHSSCWMGTGHGFPGWFPMKLPRV